jgi:Ran GTPase-activating protein (RanGAP) involved in mRNA processing and transport
MLSNKLGKFRSCILMRLFRYQHIRSLRFWKTFCEDEGVRAICQFLQVNKTITVLELLDNKITPLGCEFLGKVMHPNVGTSI